MKPLYAVLLDGGFVIKKLQGRLRHFPRDQDVIDECNRIKSRPELDGYELLRIYFYHAMPPSITIENPIDNSPVDLSQNSNFRESERLLKTLELQPDFALRLGEAVTRGWRLGTAAMRNIARVAARPLEPRDLVPNIAQKGVDLRIGLDIARLALREQVRVIVVVTGDADMVPAFKFARREGVRVYLDHMGNPITRDLKAHADLVF